jgi:hypothetical protein
VQAQLVSHAISRKNISKALLRMRSPCFLRIRFTVLQEQGRLNWCLIHRASHAGYFHMSQIIRCTNDTDVVRDDRFGSIIFGTIRSPDSDYEISPVFPLSFRDIIRLSDLSCTSYVSFIEYDCFGSDLHCRFHPSPCSVPLKAEINTVTILGKKR